jgi:hypothetical protein
MGGSSIWKKLKLSIGGLAFRIFIWSIEMTDDEYYGAVYEQEKYLNEKDNEQTD